jgi:zinc protease
VRHQQGSDREEGTADADLRGPSEGPPGVSRFARLGRLAVVAALCTTATLARSSAAPDAPGDVLKATLANGLRVVVVRNTLAPVVSTDLAYLVGSRDDPPAFPGMAHAQEHMMFRGTRNLTTSQLLTIATALGGNFNAETSDTLTQFEFTVPASDLDAVFHLESDRMRDVLDAQPQWADERGAIEQEVLRDESAPGGDFFRDAQALAFAGTPYAHQGVGTRAAFDKLTGPELKAFWERWYAPNNAVLVVAGDVDPPEVLERVRSAFGTIPRRALGVHASAPLAPLRRTVLHRATTLSYPFAAVGFRMPGVRSPDFLPSFVLQQILGAVRGPIHALADSGQALDAEWLALPYVPEGQLAFATAALGPGSDPSAMSARLEAILRDYVKNGVPRELFETTKRQAIADQEQSRNSIAALASDWATTIALDDEPSIAREQALLASVTLADVDRVAKKYLVPERAIVAALTPSAGATENAPPAPPQTGPEKPLDPKGNVTRLPAWAAPLLAHIDVPPSNRDPVSARLPNGLTLIVQPETISDSVIAFGRVRSTPVLEEPAGKEGVASVLEAMFPYGTSARDRAAFQRAQDDLDSQIGGGAQFGLQTTSASFGRAIDLLAENELHPRFDEVTFAAAKQRAIEELRTALNSTGGVAQVRATEKLVPPGDPTLRRPTPESIEALTLDDVRAYYKKAFRPDLTTFVVVGNVSAEIARAAVARAFGGWSASGAPPPLELPPIPPNAPAEIKLTLPSLAQETVSLYQSLDVTRSSPAYPALELGNAVLGGGALTTEQSRLFRDLRQNAGLVYSVDSQLAAQGTRGQFTVEFASSPGNGARIVDAIGAEIARLQTEPVGDFELSLVKASIVRRTIVADASADAIAASLLDEASSGLALDRDRSEARDIVATDAAAVRAAFAKYIHPDRFVRVVVGP